MESPNSKQTNRKLRLINKTNFALGTLNFSDQSTNHNFSRIFDLLSASLDEKCLNNLFEILFVNKNNFLMSVKADGSRILAKSLFLRNCLL